MKMILGLFAIVLSVTASAANYTDLAFEAGFRNQNADITGGDTNAQTGYQLGLSAAFPVADQVSIRSGLFYTQKNFQAKGTPNQDIKFTYVEVPLTVMFKFVDYAGIYGGVNLSMNMDNDCGSVSCQDVKSFTTPILIGAAFKFAPQFGANVYFESMSGEAAKDIKNFKAIGANLMITFD